MAERNFPLTVAVMHDPRPGYLVAAAALLPANIFSGICTGRLQPTPAQRARIAEALGMSEADLFADELAEARN